MSKTSLDRYFALLDSADATGLEDLFTENATALYGGETARGREWIVRLHQTVLSRRERSEHVWTTVAETGSRLVAQWTESGVDLRGKEFTALGHAVADLDGDGRIKSLRLSFEPGGSDWARVAVGRHLEAWATEDPDERRKVMEQVYREDIEFLEMDEAFVGHAAVSARADQVLAMAPPVLIQIEGVIQNHDYVQWEWSLVHPVAGEARGWEVFHLDGDLIDTLVVFSSSMDVVVDGVH
jgi:hypothetical protein